jgi:hypothetical protein
VKTSGRIPFQRNTAPQPSILKMEAVCCSTTYIISYKVTVWILNAKETSELKN